MLLAQAAEQGEHTLKRSLGPVSLTALGIGSVIGAGIFVLTGQAAEAHAGPAITISFIIAGLVCALAALCYAELASTIPVAGSAYTYAYATVGEFFAWIIAWDLIVEYLFAGATVAVGWSGYFVGMMADFGVLIPAAWSQAPYLVNDAHQLVATGAILNVPAMAVIGITAAVLIAGITESAVFNNAIVLLKVSVVLLVIIFGFLYVNPANWQPFIPAETTDPITGASKYGLGGIFAAAGVIFFAYIGFETISTAAQETKNPQRTLPIGILASLAICTVLYILMSLVITGLAPYTTLNVPAPVYVAVDNVGPQLAWLKPVVTIGATVGLASTIMALLYGQSRIFYAMSRDGLLPPIFSKVHPKRRTPWAGTALTAIFAGLMAGLFPIGLLGELVSVGTLLAFSMICGAVLYLRVTRPDLPRAFKTPLVWLVAPGGMLACLYLISSLPAATFVRLVVWLAIGIVVYFGYAYWHSRYHEKTVGAAQ
ncbi:amino acid permease [Phenylobacterium sp.]|uniref:amino acid permease n=1 Tax=Phenylobacterium sp. TaxID=1871053 RepID=UPI0027301F8C|nr:amino acid permease [Phenylobacterium sp.]MDP1616460.1 amino acid permease [Phenylobacterium sp.]MDP1988007.1 amino acid permease [Phenylobacterium sp.]